MAFCKLCGNHDTKQNTSSRLGHAQCMHSNLNANYRSPRVRTFHLPRSPRGACGRGADLAARFTSVCVHACDAWPSHHQCITAGPGLSTWRAMTTLEYQQPMACCVIGVRQRIRRYAALYAALKIFLCRGYNVEHNPLELRYSKIFYSSRRT